jgi:hypothetical protein
MSNLVEQEVLKLLRSIDSKLGSLVEAFGADPAEELPEVDINHSNVLKTTLWGGDDE